MFEVFEARCRTSLPTHTLSGFFRFKEVSHGTEQQSNPNTQSESGWFVQHENGQHHLYHRRSFQRREQGHLGGQDEAADV